MKKLFKTYWLIISLNVITFSFLSVYLDISATKKTVMITTSITLLCIGMTHGLSGKKDKKSFIIQGDQVIFLGVIKNVGLKKDSIISLEIKRTWFARLFNVFRVRIGTFAGAITIYTTNGDYSGLIQTFSRISSKDN